MAVSFQDSSWWSSPPGIRTLVQFSLMSYLSWCVMLIAYGRGDGVSLCRLGCKRLCLLFWVLFCFPSLLSLSFYEKQRPCCWEPFGEAHIMRNWHLQSIASEELKPTNNQASELEADSSAPAGSWDDHSPGQHLDWRIRKLNSPNNKCTYIGLCTYKSRLWGRFLEGLGPDPLWWSHHVCANKI